MRILYYIFSSPDKWAFHRRYFRCVDFRTTSVAGGVGSDAVAEAVDGRAEAMQLDVVDSRIVDVGWLSRNRSWIRHEGWLRHGLVAVEEMAGGWLLSEGGIPACCGGNGWSTDEGEGLIGGIISD